MKKAILFLLLVVLGLVPSCRREEAGNTVPAEAREEITAFEYRRTSPVASLVVTGEAAAMTPGRETAVSHPAGRIETSHGRVISLKTDPDGEALLSFDQASGQVSSLVLTGAVELEMRNESGELEMRAECARLTYDYGKQEILLEGSPVIYHGRNEFRGETIRYLVGEGRIHIERAPSGLIYLDGGVR